MAKAYGAKKVIGVGISKARTEFAKKYAADGVFVPERASAGVDPVDASRAIGEKTVADFGLGEGADVILECTGAEPCIQAGVFAAKKGASRDGKGNVVFPITTACIRALNIKGSIRYSAGCYQTAVDMVAFGEIDVKSLITHRFKFEEAEKAFELVKKGQEDVLKVVIEGVLEMNSPILRER